MSAKRYVYVLRGKRAGRNFEATPNHIFVRGRCEFVAAENEIKGVDTLLRSKGAVPEDELQVEEANVEVRTETSGQKQPGQQEVPSGAGEGGQSTEGSTDQGGQDDDGDEGSEGSDPDETDGDSPEAETDEVTDELTEEDVETSVEDDDDDDEEDFA